MNKEDFLVGDEDGLKVTNSPVVAKHVAERLRECVGLVNILEVCCGIGSTTIELAKVFPKVFAVDINPKRIEFAKKNILSAGLSNVEFFSEDIFEENLFRALSSKKIDVVHTDVEWTTTGIYGQDHATDIEKTTPNTSKLFQYLQKGFTENICMRLPKSINREQLRNLANCEIEEVYKNGELKFIYVYGQLARKPISKINLSF